MKNIFNNKSKIEMKKFLSVHFKPNSILTRCKENFMHRSIKLSEINPNRFETFDIPKRKQNKLVKQKNLDPILKRYYLEETKEKELKLEENANVDESNVENQFQYPVLLTKKIEAFVKSPHLKKEEFEKLNKNPNSYYEILINSSIVKELDKILENSKNFEFYKTTLLYLTVYIKFLFYNFPILIQDSKISEILLKCIKIANLNTKNSKTEEAFFYNVEYFYEIIQIRDRLINSSKNIDKVLVKSLEKYVCDIFETWDSLTTQFVLKLVNDLEISQNGKMNKNFSSFENNSKMNYLLKLIFIEAKIIKSGNFLNKFYNTNDRKKFVEFISNLNLENFDMFNQNIEKKIIFYLCLKNLKLFQNKEMIRNIKFQNFNFDSFHILYKGLLKKPGFREEINLESLRKEILTGLNMKNLFHSEEIKKFKLMSETIDYFVFANMTNFTILNKVNYIQQGEKQFLFSLVKKILHFLPKVSESDDIFFVAYFMASFVYDSDIFKLIKDKTFNIEEVNSDIFRKFIEALNNRLNYLLRYEHEMYMLKKTKKKEFIPYSESLDKFIVSITRQFLYRISDKSKEISKELFENGVKCLKILIEMDIYDPNYEIDGFVKQSIKPLINSCLIPGSKYFKHLTSSSECINDFLEISPFLKYYYDKQGNDANVELRAQYMFKIFVTLYWSKSASSSIQDNFNQNIENSAHVENIFEYFVLNMIKKNPLKDENDLRMLSNLSEYVILETMANPSKAEIDIFQKIISGLISHYKKLFYLQGKDKEKTLSLNSLFSEYPENQLPILMINVYNILTFNKDQFKEFISYLQEYIIKIQGLKNLKGYDLLKLRKELVNEKTLHQFVSNFQSIQIPKKKENFLTELTQKSILKNFIMNIYNSVETTSENNISLIEFSSLSYLTSLVFESLSLDEIIKILKFLGTKKFENYHPNFVKNLLTKFTNRELLFSLLKNSEDHFFGLATNWPLFVKNNELTGVLLHCHKSKLLQISRYQIINVFSFNNINHSSLLSFFGKSIPKIKNLQLKKKIMCDYIYNCAYIGYKMDTESFNYILSLYEQIHKDIVFALHEIVDIIAVGLTSNITDSSLSDTNKKTYFEIVELIHRNVSSKLFLEYENREIVYYPSIPSEDRFFQKSLLNIYSISDDAFENNLIREEDEDEDEEEETKDEIPVNRTPDATTAYARDSKEGQTAIDSKFENFFLKKKESVFGHQINVNDNIDSSMVIKKWCIAKLFGMMLEDEYLENQLTHILNKHQHANKHSNIAEKFYLKMLSYGFQHNLNIESMYKEKITGLKVDYFVTYKNVQSIIIYVPETFTSHDIQEDKKKPDGIYSLMIECLRRLTNYKIIPVMECHLPEFTELDYQERILKIILDDNN